MYIDIRLLISGVTYIHTCSDVLSNLHVELRLIDIF